MCGRYATTRGSAQLGALFEAYDDTGGALVPDYNVAPTDRVPIVRMSRQRAGRVVQAARWGFVPAWAQDPRIGVRMINARAETVAGARAFAASFARRRCLVPADGWFEWVRRRSGAAPGPAGGPRKQAYYMTPRDGGPVVFAGLWSIWERGTAPPLLTCAIITTAAIGELALVHERMPLILPAARWSEWLAGGGDPILLLAPPARDVVAALEVRPVGPAVGDVRNDGSELIAPVPTVPLDAPGGTGAEVTLF